MIKLHRQVERTRTLLEKALIELISERGYEPITIQDIADRANVGRSTFYAHYTSKDELFLSCHKAVISTFHHGSLHPLSRETLLSPEVPKGMASAYKHLEEARELLYPIFQGKDSTQTLQRLLRDWSAEEIETSLRGAFAEDESAIPFDVLAAYLAGAQLALVQWWLEKRRPHTAENLAQIFHRLQRTAIRDALGLKDTE